jgi:hypothetical protein
VEAHAELFKDDRQPHVTDRRMMQIAFDEIIKEVGKDKGDAYKALAYAITKSPLEQMAAHGFGEAAARGHRPSLEMLLNYKANGIKVWTATSALKPAAEKLIPEAVEFMLTILSDDKTKASRSLWPIAADALGSAAARGDLRAKAAIRKYADSIK